MARRVSRKVVKEVKEETGKEASGDRKRVVPTRKNTVPTGSTLLNLACTDTIHGGFVMGKMVNIIGDSSSGKTFLALSVLAEMANDPRFDDYTLVYDDAEFACQFDIEYLFGEKVARRIVDDRTSVTATDWYATLADISRQDKPFIYVLDSLDALTTVEEQERAEALSKGKEVGGSYKTEKPRLVSEVLRECVDRIDGTESILIVISQTRDKIGATFGQKKTRSGGRALKFYLTHEIWLSVAKKILRHKREVGANVIVKVSKNKVTGKVRKITFPLYYDYGIDDISSCIDFLVDETWWVKRGTIIEAPEFEFEGQKRYLVAKIEKENLEGKLREITGTVWEETEEKLRLNRKRRYK